MEIIENYSKKMGTPAYTEQLELWFISLERFKKGSPMSLSLIQECTNDINYFNSNDRISFMKHNPEFHQIPKNIIKTMVGDFIFQDITSQFNRFFKPQFFRDK
jgi:hypothetical protein